MPRKSLRVSTGGSVLSPDRFHYQENLSVAASVAASVATQWPIVEVPTNKEESELSQFVANCETSVVTWCRSLKHKLWVKLLS